MTDKQPYGTVLIKAARIMDLLASTNEALSLQQISRGTDLTSSTALKILDTLVIIGYVNKDLKTKHFTLGSKLIRYANRFIEQQDLVFVARPFLEELQSKVNETIHLGVPKENGVMYVEKLEPKNQSIYMTSRIGGIRSLYSSAMGKAILAEYGSKELEQYFERTELIPYTAHTITNYLQLQEEIKNIQQVGVAFDDEEMEADCFCVGAALLRDREVVGAFSVSMPKYRLTSAFREKIILEIKKTKMKIEEVLNQ